MILKNGTVCTKDFEFINTDLKIENGIITETGAFDGCDIDCTDKIVLPGFIDIHIHACKGADCTDGKADSALKMSRYLASCGVTSFCPTTMTIPLDELKKSFENIENAKGKEEGAYIQGINMEGPFISPAKKGAQAEENIIKPDFEAFRALNDISEVKLVDIAPETEGAIEFIAKAKDISRVSAAHTTADYETVKEAEKAGLSHATHLFNAMTQFTAREPGTVGAVFDSESITAELICDGIHISPPALRTAFRTLGEDRTVVISDAMMAAGLSQGEYTLGGQKVIVDGKAARLPDGTLAGSITNLFDEFRNIISYGVPLKQAIKSVTINPAKCIGADRFTGSVETGKYADLIIVSKDFSRVEKVIIKGRIFE